MNEWLEVRDGIREALHCVNWLDTGQRCRRWDRWMDGWMDGQMDWRMETFGGVFEDVALLLWRHHSEQG